MKEDGMMKRLLKLGILAFVVESNQLTRNIVATLVADAGIASARAEAIAARIATGVLNRLEGFALCWWLALVCLAIGVLFETCSGGPTDPTVAEALGQFGIAEVLYVFSSICLAGGLFFVLLLLTFFVIPSRQDLEISSTAWERFAKVLHQIRKNIYLGVYVMLGFALFLSLKPLLPGIPIYVVLPAALFLAMLFVLPVALDKKSSSGAGILLLFAFLLLTAVFLSYGVREVKDAWGKYISPHVTFQKKTDLTVRANSVVATRVRGFKKDKIRKATDLYDCALVNESSDSTVAGLLGWRCKEDKIKEKDDKKTRRNKMQKNQECSETEDMRCSPLKGKLSIGDEIFVTSGKMVYLKEDGFRMVFARQMAGSGYPVGFVPEDTVEGLYADMSERPWWGEKEATEKFPSTKIRYLKRGESVTIVLSDLLPHHTLVNGYGTWTVTGDRPTLCWAWTTDEGKNLVRADTYFSRYPFAVKGITKTGTWIVEAMDSQKCPLPVTLHFTCNEDCLGGR